MILTLAIIAAVLVLLVGLLIFWLQRKSQHVVPDVADRKLASPDQVVGVDENGAPITAADEGPTEARSTAPFESLLQGEIHERGMDEPAADDDD